MSTLCKGSDKRLAHDADKVAKRLEDGSHIFECQHCHRLSHNEEHLCKPQPVRVVALEAPVVESALEGTVPAPESPAPNIG